MERLDTRLEGPVLLEPVVHGDARGFFHESYRRNVFARARDPRRVRPGQPLTLRSRGVVRGMHFQVGRRDGEAGSLRPGRDRRRGRRPPPRTRPPWRVGGVRAERRKPAPALLPDRLRARVLRGERHRRRACTSARRTTTRASSAASGTTIPTWRSSGPSIELIPSERDATAPRLGEIEDELPFRAHVVELSASVVPARPPAAHRPSRVGRDRAAARRSRSVGPAPARCRSRPASTVDVEPGDLDDRARELVPGARARVREVKEARRRPRRPPRQRPRQVRGEGGGEPLVGDHPERSPCSRALAIIRVTKLPPFEALPCIAVETRRANDQRVGRVRERGVLAGELGDRVDAARRGTVALRVGLRLAPVEHVVGAEVDQLGALLAAQACASRLTARTFTSKGGPPRVSHTSTLWKAAQLTTSVGESVASAAATAASSVMSSSSRPAARDLAALRQQHAQVRPELAARRR